MNDKEERALDTFSAKLIRKAGLEAPSPDFTSKVMHLIEKEARPNAVVYTPLISRPVWWMIAAGVTLLLGYLIFGSADTDSNNIWTSWLEQTLSRFEFPQLESNWEVPTTMVYGMLALVILVGVEISLIKKRYQ